MITTTEDRVTCPRCTGLLYVATLRDGSYTETALHCVVCGWQDAQRPSETKPDRGPTAVCFSCNQQPCHRDEIRCTRCLVNLKRAMETAARRERRLRAGRR